MKTMLDIFKEEIPEEIKVIKVKEKANYFTVHLEFNGYSGKTELPKTCSPGYEKRVCFHALCVFMAEACINANDLKNAESWLKKITNPNDGE